MSLSSKKFPKARILKDKYSSNQNVQVSAFEYTLFKSDESQEQQKDIAELMKSSSHLNSKKNNDSIPPSRPSAFNSRPSIAISHQKSFSATSPSKIDRDPDLNTITVEAADH